MTYTDILFEKRDGVATVTINRPEVLNAFRTTTILELTEVIGNAGDDPSVGIIVVSGVGERAFCVGGDIAEMRELTPQSGRVFLQRFAALLWAIRRAPKPVIAAVHGYCLGGGNEINVACDLTLASEDAVFGQVGPTVGSAPVLGGSQFLPRLVGEKRAREIIFLCRRYTAKEAEALGWVNKVMPKDRLAEEVKAWTDRILELSPQALRVAKASLNYESDQLYGSFAASIEMLSAVYGSEELCEGMTAFLERRKPDFARFRTG
jgi:dihydroxynaphthoic acid synthetase